VIFKTFKIKDLVLIKPEIFKDGRGHFFEAFNKSKLEKYIKKKIKIYQLNKSYSKKDTLRGIHFQKKPFEQGKIISVNKGEIFDVAVDLRTNSKTYFKHQSVILNEKNKYSFWIPPGFGHGFKVLSRIAEVEYLTTEKYQPKYERSIRFDDKKLSIKWPRPKKIFISKKDENAPFLKDLF